MALVPLAFQLIAPRMRGERVLSFGHPDILMPVDDAARFLGKPLALRSTFGLAHKCKFELPDTLEAFIAAGALAYEPVDAFPSRHTERVIDLNNPLPAVFHERYGVVLDAGTTEHCANVGQAIRNAAQCVAPDGFVLHAPPLTMANHGYYNICPALLADMYLGAGWSIEHFSMHEKTYPFKPAGPVQVESRFAPPDGLLLLFIARRVAGAQSVPPWPVQRKYRGSA